MQWRSQELFPGEQKSGGLGDGSPQWCPGAKPRWGSGAQPTEADDLTIKYVQLYSTYVNQGRSDDSDTAHSADTDRQWHRHHHHTPALPPPHPSLPNISSDLQEIQKWSWAVRGSSCSILLHTSYATGTVCWCVAQSVVAKGLLVSIADKSNYVPVFLNFSAQTSSIRTQEMIEAKLEKKRKNILGRPPLLVHGQVTVIFVVSVGLSVCLSVCLFVCLCRVFLSRVMTSSMTS